MRAPEELNTRGNATEESIKEAKILGNVKDTPDEQVKVNVLSFSD